MISLFRNQFILKSFAALGILLTVSNILQPWYISALTSGPTTPEVSSFSPIGGSELVNTSTGEFSYNIPLLDVDGYPINLAYSARISPEQDASMVGLGWNINLGTVTRDVRGIPDDFNEDNVERIRNVKKNETTGFSGGITIQLIGKQVKIGKLKDKAKKIVTKFFKSNGKASLNLGLNAGIFYNNYNGFGIEHGIDLAGSIGNSFSGSLDGGINFNSQDGMNITGSTGLGAHLTKNDWEANGHLTFGSSYNSRMGLQSVTLSGGIKCKQLPLIHGMQSYTYSFAAPTYTPSIDFPMVNKSFSGEFTLGGEVIFTHMSGKVGGYYSSQELATHTILSPAYGYLYSHYNKATKKNVLHDFNREKDLPYRATVTKHLAVPNYTYDTYNVSGHGVNGSFRPHRSEVGVLHDGATVTESSSIGGAGEVGLGVDFHAGGNIMNTKVATFSGRWSSATASRNKYGFVDPQAVNGLYEPVFFRSLDDLTTVDPEVFSLTPTMTQAIGNMDVVAPMLLDYDQATAELKKNDGSVVTASQASTAKLKRSQRAVRTTTFSYRTFSQLISDLDGSPTTSLGTYYLPFPAAGELTNFYTVKGVYKDDYRKPHHIAEVSITQPSGVKYVYGQAAYNITKKEVSFAVEAEPGQTWATDQTLVPYTAADASLQNTKGTDNYYDAVTTPAYAYAWHLTQVLGPDYADIDRISGPSIGDYGSWHRIMYTVDTEVVATPSGGTKTVPATVGWRTPLAPVGTTLPSGAVGVANLTKGILTNPKDDKASYVYGKKEVWRPSVIMSRNYVAVFEYEERLDLQPIVDEHGAINMTLPSAQKRLKAIHLYNREEFDPIALEFWSVNLNVSGPTPQPPFPTPIKSVHFKYDYVLCSNTPATATSLGAVVGQSNPNQAKLTLVGLYFTYKGMTQGEYSPYTFTYDHNPEYDLQLSDRWGTYQSATIQGSRSQPILGRFPVNEYPYTDQRVDPLDGKRYADTYASAWLLNRIELPSGGAIEVNYESHDYAYIQNRLAGQMISVTGVYFDQAGSPNLSAGPKNILYKDESGWKSAEWLEIQLPTPVKNTNELYYRYLRGYLAQGKNSFPESVYFSFMLKMGTDFGSGEEERISGYLDLENISSYQLVGSPAADGTYSKAYLKVKLVPMKDNENDKHLINPITMAGFNFVRSSFQDLLYGGPLTGMRPIDLLSPSLADALYNFNTLATATARSIDNLGNPYKSMRRKGIASSIHLTTIEGTASNCWIRLNNPDGFKHGGGARVKDILLYDNWELMSGVGNKVTRGIHYDYTTEAPKLPANYAPNVSNVISSGVAAYEPTLGGDENPFHQPVAMKQVFKLAADAHFFIERPLGESFFPAPTIIYSKVSVTDILPADNIRNGTGKTVHEYYTAKDFPIIGDETIIDPKLPSNISRISSLLSLFIKSDVFCTVAQGFMIKRNNMHGTLHSRTMYNTSGSVISSEEYRYRTEKEYKTTFAGIDENTSGAGNLLKNTSVPVITQDGKLSYRDMGISVDLVMDEREQKTVTESENYQGNYDQSLGFPLPMFWVVPSFHQNRFRSIAAMKVVDQVGLLDRVIRTDGSASTTTQNEGWDAATGEVIYSSVSSDYNNVSYSQIGTLLDKIYTFTYPAWWNYAGLKSKYVSQGYSCAGSDLLNPPAGSAVNSVLRSGDMVLIFNPNSVVDLTDDSYSFGWLHYDNAAGANPVWKIVENNGAVKSVGDFAYQSTSVITVIRPAYENRLGESMGEITAINPLFDGAGNFKLASGPVASSQVRILDAQAVVYSDVRMLQTGNTGFATTFYFKEPCTSPSGGAVLMQPYRSTLGASNLYIPYNAAGTGSNYVNPYLHHVRGFMYPEQAYGYLTDRTNPLSVGTNNSIALTSLHQAGVYSTAFEPFWVWNGTRWTVTSVKMDQTNTPSSTANGYWKGGDRVSLASANGYEVESWNPLKLFSSALFQLTNAQPVMVSKNARYTEIGVDDFEALDNYTAAMSTGFPYGFSRYFFNPTEQSNKQYDLQHFTFRNAGTVSSADAHSGRKSLRCTPGGTSNNMTLFSGAIYPVVTAPAYPASTPAITVPFVPTDAHSLGFFKFYKEASVAKKYVISMWVKPDFSGYTNNPLFTVSNPGALYKNINLRILEANCINMSTEYVNRSAVINGWQKIEAVINLPANTSVTSLAIAVAYDHTAGNIPTALFLDDIRVHPFDAEVETFVYDYVKNKLLAKGDANSYFTFFMYDIEGRLLSTKVETEKGILSTGENRSRMKEDF